MLIAIVQLLNAASIPEEMDDVAANNCDYFHPTIRTEQSNKILNTTEVVDETIELQFDIKLADPCNSLCNIMYVGNVNDATTQYPSLSINGLTNHIELLINNSHHNLAYEIPNASYRLPADNQYYNIYLYISPNIIILRVNYTLIVYNYYQVFSPITNISYYSIYTSDPWHEPLNASISNLCITSNNVKSHGVMKCGDVIKGELISRSDVHYYYFNLSETQSVLLDACTSSFDTYLYLYHKNNLSILYEQDDDDFCELQTVLWITSLPADEYILAISGYETFKDHDYGGWELEILCDKHYNYSYISLNEYKITFLEAETECRRRFGTTLATVITEQDVREIKMSMPNTMKYADLWIGLYDNNIGESEWKWIAGTVCDTDNSTNGIPCTNFTSEWRPDQPDVTKYGAYLSFFTNDRETVLRHAGAMDQQSGNDGMICNAPNGKYSIVNCENDLNNCWTDMDCCNDSVLESDIHFKVFEFQPAVAVYNSMLFVVGLNQVHYTNINLFSPHINWKHFTYHSNNQSYNHSINQWYSQYESWLYIYLTNATHGTLTSINLYNYTIESIVSPTIMTDVCVVSDQYNVFILSGATIKLYNISEKTWRESAIFHHVYAACALDQEDHYIYIFGKLEYTLYKYDIHKDVFVVVDKVTNLCYTDTGRGITERNDKIYLHGCSVGSWRTIVYDIKSEIFEPHSINMRNITNNNSPYHQTGQLATFEDNVLLLFHTTDNEYPSWGSTPQKSEIKLHYAITDLISINVQQTQTDEETSVWPSDGFYIKYYINDFTNFSDMIHNVWLISNTTNIIVNESITLNISNDNCSCNEISYKCSKCRVHFNLSTHLSTEENNINEVQFSLLPFNQSITSIVPQYVSIHLQRCTIWFKNENPHVETTLLETNDARIEFSFNLSGNCYTKTNANFSVNITAPLINLHKQLKISVIDKNLIAKKICNKHGEKCHSLRNNFFYFLFDPNEDNKDKPIDVFMKSNSIDLYIESPQVFVVDHEHMETNQIIIGVVVGAFVIVAVIIVYFYWRNKKLKMKSEEQRKHKKVITNPMVLAISIGHYIDDCVKDVHCLELDGINRDYENVKNFCGLYKYKIYPKRLKIEWKSDEIVEFLVRKANDLSTNFQDTTNKRKFDSLLVFISGHGSKNKIITSDYKTISKTAIHRIFSSKFPNIRLLPRVFVFDCCSGDQQRNIISLCSSSTDIDMSIDSAQTISDSDELEQLVGKGKHKIPDNDEVKEEKTCIRQHISGGDVDQAAIEAGNGTGIWVGDEANPDFRVCLVHAANEGFQAKMNIIDGSYLIYELIKGLIDNISKKRKLFFGEIIAKIQNHLHDRGVQQITSTFNNYTTYLKFKVNSNKSFNQASVTQTHDNLEMTEILKEEQKEQEKDTAIKPVKAGESYKEVNEHEDSSDSN